MTFNRTLVAMAAFAVAAIVGVLARPLLPVDETRYLAVAWEMRQSGEWLVPHLNGAIYTHKPPLLFWLVNLVWSVFGVNDSARLVGPAFGVAAIAATSLLARRLWPDQPGVGGRAAVILAGFGVFGLFAGLTMFDAMLTLAVVLGVLALVESARTPRAWLGFGAALALGAFAKGPVILVHLLPVALLMPWWARTQIGAVLRGLAIAVPVGTAIVAVWLVPAILVGGPDYRDAVLWSQSAGRMTNSFAHVQPWWFFLAALPLLLWPWAWSADVWRAVRSARRSDGGLRLSAAWALSALALFSLISGKQIHYLLPALPAVALALARALGDARVRAPLAGVLPALLGAALVAVAFGAAGAEPAALARPGWVAALVGVALIGLGAASLRVRGGGVAALGLAAPPVAALMFALGSAGPIYDAAPIGRLLAAHEAAGVAILANEYHGEFSYAGRLTRPLTVFDDLSAATDWLDDIPGRALLARLDKPHPDSAPAAQVVYRNRPYGLWTAAPARPDPGEPAA